MNQNLRKTVTRHDFASDLRSILQDGETLFKDAGQQIWNEYLAARECLGLRVGTPTSDARHGLTSVEESILTQAREVARHSDDFVRQHPWRAAAAGVCIGLVIGAIVANHR